MFDDVDLQSADLDAMVTRQLERGDVGKPSRDDRSNVDWLKRAWSAVGAEDRGLAQRLGAAVGRQLGRRGTLVDGLVLRFFLDLPRATGYEPVLVAAERGLDRYPPGQPDPSPGSGNETLRVNILRVALDRIDEDEVPDSILEAARSELLAGRGRELLYGMFDADGSWVNTNLDHLLAAYPSASAAFYRHLLGDGDTPEHALDRLLPHADGAGREALVDDIGHRFRQADEQREALLAKDGAAQG